MRFHTTLLRLYSLDVLYQIATGWGGYLLIPFLFLQGFSISDLLLLQLLTFSGSLPLFFLHKVVPTKRFLLLAFFYLSLGYLLLLFTTHLWLLVLWGVLLSIRLFYYYVPYNTRFFEVSDHNHNALMTSIYFFSFPATGLVIPALSGYVAERLGFPFLFLSGALGGLVLVWLSRLIPEETLQFRLRESWDFLTGLRLLIFLEGFWESIPIATLAVFTILYLQTPLSYGLFFSYLGLVALLASVLIAFVSDKYHNRHSFLIPLCLLISLSTAALAFSTSLTPWVISGGLLRFLMLLAWPFMTAIIVDRKGSMLNAMAGRELLLNLGRSTGILLILLLFLAFQSYKISYLLISLIFLAYPLLLYLKKIP